VTLPEVPKSLIKFWHKLDDHTNGWLWVLVNSVKETLMPDTAMMASAISYIALFSLFPLILLSISIASFSFGPTIDQHVTIQRLEFIAPALSQLLGQNIEEIIRARGPVTSFALLSLVWSASTIFYTITHAQPNMECRTTALKLENSRGGDLICARFRWPNSFVDHRCGQRDLEYSLLAARANPAAWPWNQFVIDRPARYHFIYGAIYAAPAWSVHLARGVARSHWSWLALGIRQENFSIFCCHLHFNNQPGLRDSSDHYRISIMGIHQQSHFYFWGVFERQLLEVETEIRMTINPSFSPDS